MYKKNYKSANIRGKLRVCQYLSSNKQLKRHVPHTVSFTLSNLKMMTKKYKSVYVKLDVGSLGIGVYKVKRLTNSYKLYSTSQKKQKQKTFKTVTALYYHLKSRQSKRMIIQKDVYLDNVNGRPYDIRAMVQRKPGKKWTCTGFLVKVGAPNKIVTNYYQGGKIYTLRKLLRLKGYSLLYQEKITEELTQKALKISRTLSKKRSGMHEMGIDFAYDSNNRLWVLEVNSNHPQYHPLKTLDPEAYWRIKSFAKSYGRK